MREIPTHIAFIVDGNGRWAKSIGMPRTYGHTKGAANLEPICKAAWDLGVKYVTLYLFSTENWKRSDDEIHALMQLFRQYTKICQKKARDNNMRVRILGDPSAFAPQLRDALLNLEEESKNNTGLNLQLAMNYGSRDEIRRAVQKISGECLQGHLKPEEITEETISSFLDTADIPDPDLLIRTSGEQRLSNYLMWQLAYAELYFTPVPWPAFTGDDLRAAVEAYGDRDRRYGGVK